MIAAISIMRRRPDLTRGAFDQHWLHPHGTMTAELPGLRHYVQHHFRDDISANDAARSLGIDGIPQLRFDDYEARRIAYTSPRIAECNVDSEAFVGAVTRLVTEPREVVRPHSVTRAAKAIVIALGPPDPAWEREIEERALAEPAVVEYVGHRLLEQAAAPASRIPELALAVAGFAEVTFESPAALTQLLAAIAADRPRGRRVAFLAVEDYKLK